MAIGQFHKGSVRIRGRDGAHTADVEFSAGKRRQLVDATVQVESLLGKVVFPFTYLEVLDVGSNGDTNRFQIPDDSIDITTTKTASEVTVNDLAKKIRDELNADSNFDALYDATTPRSSNLVCVQAKLIQTLREDPNDVTNVQTGTMDVVLGFDVISDQDLSLALFPHPQDCRKGTINVTGEIGVIETGRPPKRILLHTAGNSEDMAINASGGDVVFKLSNNPDYDDERDMIVTELRIESTANSFSVGSGKYIRVGQLTNGHLVQIRSDGNLEYDQNLTLLEDIHHAFAFGVGSKFDLLSSSGDGSLVAVFARPFFVRRAGTFGTADDVIVTVRDNLLPIARLQMSVVGFFED